MTSLRLALLAEERDNPVFADPHPQAAARAERLSAAQLASHAQAMLVAWEGSRAVGLLRCVEASATPLAREARLAMLTTAYVDPDYRRRGVLRALVLAAERWCRARGLAEMRLRCGVGNGVGAAAWRALGFTPAEVVYHRRLAGG